MMTMKTKTEKIKGFAGDIPVYCTHDAIMPLEELKPNPKNPNKHPTTQINLLARIIEQQGWRAPITVSTLSGYIVKGHGRYMAAQQLECPAPVDFQHYDSNEKELADMVADNRIAELSSIDETIIESVLKEIDSSGLDISVAGYEEYIFNRDILDTVEKIEQEEEYKVEAEEKAEKTKQKMCDLIDKIAEENPEKLSNALAVVVPKGRGSLKDCIFIADEACADIVQELKRYADAGMPSPLDKLISQVIRYEANIANN